MITNLSRPANTTNSYLTKCISIGTQVTMAYIQKCDKSNWHAVIHKVGKAWNKHSIGKMYILEAERLVV